MNVNTWKIKEKNFIELCSVSLPLVTGASLITWISQDLIQKGINPDKDIRFGEAYLVTYSVGFGGWLFERAIHESTSYSAGRESWVDFIDCLQVNQKVFSREFLGTTKPATSI